MISGENNDNRIGVLSGVDLTSPVILNNNPIDIEPINGFPAGSVADKWAFFYLFIQDKEISTDINSLEGKKTISVELINEFNTNKQTSVWATFNNKYRGGISNPLTDKDVFGIQNFTKKSDPNVQVDGWIGTQTIQMVYPRSNISKPSIDNYSLDSLYPVIWGNKRYVISKENIQTSKKNQYSALIYYELYNPSIHDDKLIKLAIPKIWNSIDTPTINKLSSENVKSSIIQQQKKYLQSQSKLINSL